MFIKKLLLKNFRNYVNEEFEFSEGLNIITGRNAQGKTNAVEAAFLLATGFSPKVKSDGQVIRYGNDSAEIFAEAKTNYGTVTSKITYKRQAPKVVEVNGVCVDRVSELLGNIFAVFFNPGELKLIQEAPEDRRRFLDISICQLDRHYCSALSKYKKILLQRNNLLKEPDKDLIYDTLPIWDEQLSAYAADVIVARRKYVEKLAPYAKDVHFFITDGKEELNVSLSKVYEGSAGDVRNDLLKALNAGMEKDIILGHTGIGPHRDDLKITVSGEDVKNFGSQGQQRTAAISLKLAELQIYREHFGEYPILILDDAMSELDCYRQEKLLEKTRGIQTVITCTELDGKVFSGKDYKLFKVEGGRIVR